MKGQINLFAAGLSFAFMLDAFFINRIEEGIIQLLLFLANILWYVSQNLKRK